jgi:hypothetical protein
MNYLHEHRVAISSPRNLSIGESMFRSASRENPLMVRADVYNSKFQLESHVFTVEGLGKRGVFVHDPGYAGTSGWMRFKEFDSLYMNRELGVPIKY